MKRRTFIAGLGSAAAWPIAGWAQQTAVPVVGFLSSQSAEIDYKDVTVPLLQGLKDAGYVEGQNVAVEYRGAGNQYDRPNTCASYRDMLVLLLPYVAKSKGAAVDILAVADLSAEVVRSFLAHLESERQCSTATRNQRLGSIHALARFIGAHSPQHVEWCAQIRMVPIKKGVANSVTYLEKPEIDALLAADPSFRRPKTCT